MLARLYPIFDTDEKRLKIALLLLTLIVFKFAFIWLIIFVTVEHQNNFDLALTEFVRYFSNPLLDKIMILASLPGEIIPAGLLLLLLSVRLVKNYRRKGLVLALLLVSFSLISEVLKNIVMRHRPNLFLVEDYSLPSDFSFPSGHATFYILFFGFLSLLTFRDPSLKKWRKFFLFGSLTLIFLVGISRVYLGVHWPTDVLGGYLLGLVLFEVLAAAYLVLLPKLPTPA